MTLEKLICAMEVARFFKIEKVAENKKKGAWEKKEVSKS